MSNNDQPLSSASFTSVAPGRLCLFGEHQDYLNLPVIALALPLCCRIHVTPVLDSTILELRMPASIRQSPWTCDLTNLPESPAVDSVTAQPDFILAAVHEVIQAGYTLHHGAKCVSSSEDLPIQAGVSSSSAFCVAWVQALVRLASPTTTLPALDLAKLAHQTEVSHFDAPGGTMDHVTSAFGGIVRIGPGTWQVNESLQRPSPDNISFGVWVLADSGQPKDTFRHLRRCKQDRLNLLEKLGGCWDTDSSTSVELTPDEQTLLEATLTNRDAEQSAYAEWKSSNASGKKLGAWMLQHHEALRDGLNLSTDRLEAMRQAALNAGAWGFKLVGSGGGGCGVAWSPMEHAAKVATAMEQAGAARTWLIQQPSRGAHIVTE